MTHSDPFDGLPASARTSPGAMAGITPSLIGDVVNAFYAAVHHDPLLGPIFVKNVDHDWGPHLAKMKNFWSTVLLGASSYQGRPLAAHIALGPLTPEHFDRWLALFKETTALLCPPRAALLFNDRAAAIADGMQRGLALMAGAEVAIPEPRKGTPITAPAVDGPSCGCGKGACER